MRNTCPPWLITICNMRYTDGAVIIESMLLSLFQASSVCSNGNDSHNMTSLKAGAIKINLRVKPLTVFYPSLFAYRPRLALILLERFDSLLWLDVNATHIWVVIEGTNHYVLINLAEFLELLINKSLPIRGDEPARGPANVLTVL